MRASAMHVSGPLVLLGLGIGAGAVAASRIRSGKSYGTTRRFRVDRRTDPFSFWLSVGPIALLSIALILLGLVWLFVPVS